jgi:hypothetical protein
MVLLAVFGIWSVAHLWLAWRGREGPQMRLAQFLAGTGGASGIAAILLWEYYGGILSGVFAILGIGCLGAYLYALYTRSLHNTTM